MVFFALLALKHLAKGAVLKGCWWKVWLLGFLSDVIGALWLALGLFGSWALDADGTAAGWVTEFATAMTLNPFRHPLALLWTAIGVAIAGVCIYFFDRRVFRSEPELDPVRATDWPGLAIVTAPWLFFVPVY